ncbi:collagen binding domain-containing protein [Bifidobacterium aquikefiricola]|uniref:Prealbumin-like fold domain-containing protein n=1 Tax=Bifidobacterium aquikefiricola TaxID=3059038 RepID=A0AB39U894_9BIFI
MGKRIFRLILVLGIAFGLTVPLVQIAPKQAQAANQTVFTCAPGYIYSQKSNGSVYSAGDSNTLPAWSSIDNFNDVNGISIGTDGSSAYAYQRSNDHSGIDTLLQYTPSSGWTAIDDSDYSTGLNGSLVTGAVDLSTGNYLFGGYDTRYSYYGQSTSFKLFEYVVASHTYLQLGSFSVDNITSNGDMAFDAAGNLYVVQSGNQTNIYSITAADVKSAESAEDANHQIPATKVSQLQGSSTVISNVNGVAFDSDGTIYLGNGTTLARYDPSTWQQIGANKNIPGGSSTDLASCNSPSTLTVRKNLPNGRALTNDQFTLSVAEGTKPLSSATTRGSASGIQSDELGPMPVVANTAYNFSEAMASGSDSALSSYTATWSCTNANGMVISNGAGSSGSVTIPIQTGKGAAITCTITNTPVSNGSVTWSKVDENNVPLAGSTWSLVGPINGNSTTRTVTDCVANDASGCSDSLDKDPAAGKFNVTGLPYGNYNLTETAAPSGYQLCHDSSFHHQQCDTGERGEYPECFHPQGDGEHQKGNTGGERHTGTWRRLENVVELGNKIFHGHFHVRRRDQHNQYEWQRPVSLDHCFRQCY